jgi:hypothetical protein
MLKFEFPRKHIESTSETQLVDSLEVVGDSVIATKCALHGVIYLWDLMATMAASGKGHMAITVTPICVLSWSNTDNYFMNMGCHPGENYSGPVPVTLCNFHYKTHKSSGVSSLIASFNTAVFFSKK